MTCVVKAQWGLHPWGINARVPGYTGFIPSAKAEATKGLKPLVGPRAAWRWKAHGPPSIPWPGACAGALNQRSWSTCRNPWRTLDGIRTTRRHLASGCRSCRDLKWLDLAASGWHFHTSNTHFMEDSNMFSVKNHEKFDQITQMYSMEGISTYIKSHKIPNVSPKRRRQIDRTSMAELKRPWVPAPEKSSAKTWKNGGKDYRTSFIWAFKTFKRAVFTIKLWGFK